MSKFLAPFVWDRKKINMIQHTINNITWIINSLFQRGTSPSGFTYQVGNRYRKRKS